VLVERDGRELAVRCECLAQWRQDALLAAAAIPERYRHCSVESFEIWNPKDPTLVKARKRTQELIDAYPAVDRGLLFMGRVGTGKTHLAVAALRALVEERGARGVYVNVTELIHQLQMCIDGTGASRETILQPVVDSDVVVLDELGACRSTEWVLDQLYFVINSRYMRQRLTVITTNFFDMAQPLRARTAPGASPDSVAPVPEAVSRWQETLSDRITDRLRSRLYEMCDAIELRGEDYRSRERGPGGRRR
jgi:DNA replication protein DnaC